MRTNSTETIICTDKYHRNNNLYRQISQKLFLWYLSVQIIISVIFVRTDYCFCDICPYRLLLLCYLSAQIIVSVIFVRTDYCFFIICPYRLLFLWYLFVQITVSVIFVRTDYCSVLPLVMHTLCLFIYNFISLFINTFYVCIIILCDYLNYKFYE